MRFYIEPVDTQFYRDGRPFDAGTESSGKSNFLPSSRTLYGAFRAIILSNSSTDWHSWPTSPQIREIIGSSPDQIGSLGIRGPVLAIRHLSEAYCSICPLYPIPKDLVKVKDEREYLLIRPQINGLSLNEFANIHIDKIYPYDLNEEIMVEDVGEVLLSHDNLKQYLLGQLSQEFPNILDSDELNNYINFEPRVGIGLDYKTRTAQTNLLYSVSHIRMAENVGIVVDIDNFGQNENILPAEGAFRLGGDSRPVRYTKIEEQSWTDIIDEIDGVKEMVKREGRFKFYLITPGIFQEGWYPDILSPENGCLEGKLFLAGRRDIRFRLIGACVGKPLPIGGFDIKNKHPKAINKAVPAGSVYFFEFIDWEEVSMDDQNKAISNLFNKFFYKTIYNNLGEKEQSLNQALSKEGFALTLIGGW